MERKADQLRTVRDRDMEQRSVLGTTVTAFVEGLLQAGLRHVCFAPGSRSTPLLLALAHQPAIRLWDHLDERAAAYFALGLARALEEPVAMLTTSGTAAANVFPAVVEANLSQVPLVILTADRPPELRDSGAPQTIDQVRLFGPHVKWFAEVPVPDPSPLVSRAAYTLARRAVSYTKAFPPGPIHLNLPYREPLIPRFGQGARMPEGQVRMPTPEPSGEELGDLAEILAASPRGLIVTGPQPDPALAVPLIALASRLGYPILADPLSQVRAGPHLNPLVLDTYDVLLRDAELVSELRPDLVIRLGAVPTSKPLQLALERWDEALHVVLAGGNWPDPFHRANWVVQGPLRVVVEGLAKAVGYCSPVPERSWQVGWVTLNQLARRALADQLEQVSELFEGRVFAELAQLLPSGAALFVGNSMPVRDLESFFPAISKTLRILANRGANGIDGVTSTALGVAAAHPGPTVLVTGDLSFYHDLTGLLAARRHRLRATIVLLNNDGGGIFSFLPQAKEVGEEFEFLFGTPHGLNFAHAAALFGLHWVEADSWPTFRAAFADALENDRVTVIELRTDRQRNRELHDLVWQAVAQAIRRSSLRGE